MGYVTGRSRRGGETYPEPRVSGLRSFTRRGVSIPIPIIGAPGGALLSVGFPEAKVGMAVQVQGNTLPVLFLVFILPVGCQVDGTVQLLAFSFVGSDGSQVATVDITVLDVP